MIGRAGLLREFGPVVALFRRPAIDGPAFFKGPHRRRVRGRGARMGRPLALRREFALRAGRGIVSQPDLLERFALTAQLRVAGGELVAGEDIGDDIGVLSTAESSRPVRRHGGLNLLKQRGNRAVAPRGEERVPTERGRFVAAVQLGAVATGALLRVDRLAAVRLLASINAPRCRARSLAEQSPGRNHNDEGKRWELHFSRTLFEMSRTGDL